MHTQSNTRVLKMNHMLYAYNTDNIFHSGRCRSVQDLGQDWPLLANCCYCVQVSQLPLISFDLNSEFQILSKVYSLPKEVEGCFIGCFNLIVASFSVLEKCLCVINLQTNSLYAHKSYPCLFTHV